MTAKQVMQCIADGWVMEISNPYARSSGQPKFYVPFAVSSNSLRRIKDVLDKEPKQESINDIGTTLDLVVVAKYLPGAPKCIKEWAHREKLFVNMLSDEGFDLLQMLWNAEVEDAGSPEPPGPPQPLKLIIN